MAPPMLAQDALRRILGPNQMPQTPDVLGSFLMHPQRDAQGGVLPDLPNPMQGELDAITKRDQEAKQAQFENTDPAMIQKRQTQQDMALAPEKLHNQNALDVEDKKTAGALAVAQDRDAALMKQSADKGAASANKLPNQVQVQAYNASKSVNGIDDLKALVNDPEMSRYIGTIMGRLTTDASGDYLTTDLVAQSLAEGNPQLQYKLGQLQSSLLAAIVSVARNYNQRGATKELVDAMKASFRTSQPLQTLNGTLDAHRQRLMDMANPNATTPGTDPFGRAMGLGATPAAPQGRPDPLGYGR